MTSILTGMIKIHVDTNALAEHRPAILAVQSDAPLFAPTMLVVIHCPCCGAKSATVEQHGNTAHVVVSKPQNLQILTNE